VLCHVRVFEPEVATGRIRSHTNYRVLTETYSAGDGLTWVGAPQAPGKYEARRRYSDFELLRTMLCSRYPGMVLAPLPPKGALKRPPAEERLRGLALFSQQLARVPILFVDTLVSAFFGLGDGEKWNLVARNRTDASRSGIADNQGELQWEKALSEVELPDEETIERLVRSSDRPPPSPCTVCCNA
jgi:hypothetical protein